MCTAAYNDLDVRVDHLHGLCTFCCKLSVVLGSSAADLSDTAHFVSETPCFDIKGLIKAVFAAHIRKMGRRVKIAVFEAFECFTNSTSTEIYRHHDLGVSLLCPFGELVDTNLVGLDLVPRGI